MYIYHLNMKYLGNLRSNTEDDNSKDKKDSRTIYIFYTIMIFSIQGITLSD
jgi:hypothetical protein